jgi:hypothetical protein
MCSGISNAAEFWFDSAWDSASNHGIPLGTKFPRWALLLHMHGNLSFHF